MNWIIYFFIAAVIFVLVCLLHAIKRSQMLAKAARQDMQSHNQPEKIEKLQTSVNLLIGQCDERKIREILNKLAEEIRYSNPLSKEHTEEIEEEITILFTEVESAALDGDIENTADLCERMTVLLRERDRICKHGR